MELHRLKPAKGSVRKGKRIGRGQGSGRGGTSTKGHKGGQSRSGYSKKFGFEGGQMPIQKRIPKVGFKNPFRVSYVVFNLDRLQAIAEEHRLDTIDIAALVGKKLISKNDKVKILGKGSLNAPLKVQAHAFSRTAKAAIEAKGGAAVTA